MYIYCNRHTEIKLLIWPSKCFTSRKLKITYVLRPLYSVITKENPVWPVVFQNYQSKLTPVYHFSLCCWRLYVGLALKMLPKHI